MNKKTTFLFLSGIFLVVFLILQFTDIYGDSGWFKFFVLILFATFLISGISMKQKE
jgi:hypothetical protein